MAFVETFDEEEEKKNQDDPALSRESGVISGSGLASRPSTKPSETNYTNVAQYIEANKEGIGKMAGDITGRIKGQVSKAEQDVTGAIDKFRGQQTVIGDYNEIANQLGSQGGVLNLSEPQRQTAASILRNQYGGPQDLTASQEYMKGLQEKEKALGMLSLAGKEEGTGQLIKETIKPQQYSRGEMGLDVGLLRTEPTARQSFNELSAQAPSFKAALEAKSKEAADFAANQRQRYESAQSAIREAGQGRFAALREKDTQEARDALRNQKVEEAKARVQAQRDIAEGLHRGSRIYDKDWDLGMYQTDVSPESFSGVTTTLGDQELSELAQLNELLGLNEDLPQLREASFRSPYGFDMESFLRDLNDYVTYNPYMAEKGKVAGEPTVIRRNQEGRVQIPEGSFQQEPEIVEDYQPPRPARRRDNRRFAQIPILGDIL